MPTLNERPDSPYTALQEQMKREAARREEQKRAKELVDAMEGGAPSAYVSTPSLRPMTIHEIIKQRVEDHKRMIATLEWFGAHIGLDSPDNTLVADVIMSGLRVIAARGNADRGP